VTDSGFWLCDVIRSIDALDEDRSKVSIQRDGRKRYFITGYENLIFDDLMVNKAHIFCMTYSEVKIICDDAFRTSCRAAKLQGIGFLNAIKDPLPQR